jgi:hypothetical protein
MRIEDVWQYVCLLLVANLNAGKITAAFCFREIHQARADLASLA